MLLLDRAQLVGFQPPADPEQVPHLSALLDAAAPTHYRLGATSSSSTSTLLDEVYGLSSKVLTRGLMEQIKLWKANGV
jgi:hypothetical protein